MTLDANIKNNAIIFSIEVILFTTFGDLSFWNTLVSFPKIKNGLCQAIINSLKRYSSDSKGF